MLTKSSFDKWFIFFGYSLLAAFIAYVVFLFFRGENAYVTIHDNLDSEFVYLKMLKDAHQLFDYFTNTIVAAPMGGIPRSCFRSGLNVTCVLYYFLSPIVAYQLNFFLVHIIAFTGMFLLLRNYFASKLSYGIILCVAALYTWIPFYHIQQGITVAGQPLLLFAFLNILYRQSKWTDWLIIILFPFYSFFIVGYPFYFCALVVLFIFYFMQNRNFNFQYVFAIMVLLFVYLIVEFPLVHSILFPTNYVSHREQFDITMYGEPFTIVSSVRKIIDALFVTQYHAGRFYTAAILISVVIVGLYKKLTKLHWYLIAAIIVVAFTSVVNDYVLNAFQSQNKILKIWTSDRFFYLAPLLWFTLWAALLSQFNWTQTKMKLIALALFTIQFGATLITNTEMIRNVWLMMPKDFGEPDYNNFYATKLFDEIKADIGNDITSYRVGSVGLHPAVAQYNGFYTIDGYQNNYPLAFKSQFREVISAELEKDQSLKNYFDGWGSRAYLYTSEVLPNSLISKNQNTYHITNLQLSRESLKFLNAKYIFAALPIQNADSISLQLLKTYETPTSFYIIYVYQLM